MKIIYFMERRFCYCHDKDDFSYNTFIKRGIDVEVWSSVYWQVNQDIKKPEGIDTASYIHYINSSKDLIANLERVKKDDCFFLMYSYHGYNWIGFSIRRKIKEFGFSFANITEDPSISADMDASNTIIKSAASELVNILKLIYSLMKIVIGRNDTNAFLNRVARLMGPIVCGSKYNFFTGKISMKYIPNRLEIFVRKNNYLLNANSYDEYCFSKNGTLMSTDLIPENYILFIDQGFGKKNMAFNKICTDGNWNVDKYLDAMNKLFDQLEADYHCPVVIAAHPKSSYSGNEFCGRKVVQHSTAKLIKDSKLIILHYSTCIGVVSLYKKDVLDVYMSEMDNVYVLKDTYKSIEKILGYKVLNISLDDNIKNYKKYITKHSDKQKRYLEQYIFSKRGDKQIETKYDIIARVVCDGDGNEYKM